MAELFKENAALRLSGPRLIKRVLSSFVDPVEAIHRSLLLYDHQKQHLTRRVEILLTVLIPSLLQAIRSRSGSSFSSRQQQIFPKQKLS